MDDVILFCGTGMKTTLTQQSLASQCDLRFADRIVSGWKLVVNRTFILKIGRSVTSVEVRASGRGGGGGGGDPGTLLGLCNVDCTGCVSFLLLFCFLRYGIPIVSKV